MSTVYLARHVLIERLSAIKVLHDELLADPQHAARFLREARAVNRINHPNIVEISDYGEATVALDEGRRPIVYLVMEYVPGESLRRLVQRERMHPARMLPIAAQLASALSRAHQTGVIHRDVKPDNILLQPRRDGGDLAKLTDFGVAKIARGASGADQVFGTPGYIAPEYLLGEASIDGRADLYSLGVVMYEALTGALPFEWQTATDLLTLPMTEEPIPVRNRIPQVPVPIEDLVMSCLRPRPDDRPRDAFVLLDELQSTAMALGMRAVDPSFPAAKIDLTERTLPNESSSIPTPRTTATFGSAASEALRMAAADVTERTPLPSLSLPASPTAEAGPDVLLASWYAYFAEVMRRIEPHRKAGVLSQSVLAALDRRVSLLDSLQRTVAGLAETQHALDALNARGREFRTTLGRAIDHVARDLSKAHGKVVDLKKRRVELHLQRRHATDQGAADALLWEEAAIDSDLRRALQNVSNLGRQIGDLQDELFSKNNDNEAEVLRATGVLEGESAALTTLHRELELLSGEIASQLGVR